MSAIAAAKTEAEIRHLFARTPDYTQTESATVDFWLKGCAPAPKDAARVLIYDRRGSDAVIAVDAAGKVLCTRFTQTFIMGTR